MLGIGDLRSPSRRGEKSEGGNAEKARRPATEGIELALRYRMVLMGNLLEALHAYKNHIVSRRTLEETIRTEFDYMYCNRTTTCLRLLKDRDELCIPGVDQLSGDWPIILGKRHSSQKEKINS